MKDFNFLGLPEDTRLSGLVTEFIENAKAESMQSLALNMLHNNNLLAYRIFSLHQRDVVREIAKNDGIKKIDFMHPMKNRNMNNIELHSGKHIKLADILRPPALTESLTLPNAANSVAHTLYPTFSIRKNVLPYNSTPENINYYYGATELFYSFINSKFVPPETAINDCRVVSAYGKEATFCNPYVVGRPEMMNFTKNYHHWSRKLIDDPITLHDQYASDGRSPSLYFACNFDFSLTHTTKDTPAVIHLTENGFSSNVPAKEIISGIKRQHDLLSFYLTNRPSFVI